MQGPVGTPLAGVVARHALLIRRNEMVEFIKAFVKVQAALEPAIKNSVNPHFKSKFADLTSCYEACRKILSENQIALIQQPCTSEDGSTILKTHLLHVSGQGIVGEMHVCDRTATSQQKGSALTYIRRYSLVSMVGLATEDDDGNAANEHKPKATIPPVQQKAIMPGDYVIDFGKLKGRALKDCSANELKGAYDWAVANNAKPNFQDAYLGWKQIIETGELIEK